MESFLTISTFVFSSLIVSVMAGSTCLDCTDAVTTTDCGKVTTCGDHEQCYTDVFVTTAGNIRYSMGCRDRKHCQSASSGKRDIGTSVRRSGSILICTECCDGNLCSHDLCRATGYPQDRGPICYDCLYQNSTDDCERITMCGEDQVCMLRQTSNGVTHVTRYETGCEPKQQCMNAVNLIRHNTAAYISAVGRKRTNNAVDLFGVCMMQCCDDDICNNNCASAGMTSSTTSSNNNPCQPDPCKHGSCSTQSNTFQCKCDYGYGGQLCDQVTNYCSSNPCVHGTCLLTSSGYTCLCDSSYHGTNCELPLGGATGTTHAPTTSIDYCKSNPCNMGTCTSGTNGFTCHCEPGFSGPTCSQVAVNHCSSNPCVYGTCHNNPIGYTCTCDATHLGTNCQYMDHCKVHSPCGHGTCQNARTTYKCTCDHGYSGSHCNIRDYCSSNPCSHGSCTNTASYYKCHCDAGFTGSTCNTVDHCARNDCKNGGKCVNGASSYTCQCQNGYSGKLCDTHAHEPLHVGDRVVPGQDWFLDEKVSSGTVERINDPDHPGSVWVVWDTGLRTVSQYGHNGHYEVRRA